MNDPNAPPTALPNQTDFKIMMNYELGMHCTGFEFAYCCVLPAYNSILAQVVKPQNGSTRRAAGGRSERPGSTTGPTVLGRETVVRDYELDDNGNFKKYVLRTGTMPSRATTATASRSHDADQRRRGQLAAVLEHGADAADMNRMAPGHRQL